jgi:ribosomal protein L7Ae-like RNA K-turn-binding protein
MSDVTKRNDKLITISEDVEEDELIKNIRGFPIQLDI